MSVSQSEAVALFADRARSVQPSFAVTDGNASAVASVCARLDGIPLAIELASARVRSLSVEQINTRLDQRFRLLTGGSRVALPRQQTLRALIDWSYDLLTAPEQTLLRRLSVFAGGWTLEAAEAVCSGEVVEDWEVLDLLTALVDKSQAIYEEAGAESRYRLLETVRQYAAERLAESGQAEDVQDRHLSWCVALAEEAEPFLAGSEQASWLSRLEREHDNLRTCLAWEEQASGQSAGEPSLRLMSVLWRFWLWRGYLSEGRQRLDRALASKRLEGQEYGEKNEDSAVWVKALNGAGLMAYQQSDYAAARNLFEKSLTAFKQWNDQHGVAVLLNNLGLVALGQGSFKEAQALYEEALSIRRQLGQEGGVAIALLNLGTVASHQGDHARAQAWYEESLTLQRLVGDTHGIANALNNLGNAALNQRDYAAARGFLEESRSIYQQIGNQYGIAASLANLGNTAYYQCDYLSAGELYKESLTIQRQLGNQAGIAECLDGLAGVAHEQLQLVRAAKLGGAVSSLREKIGSARPVLDQESTDEMLASAAEALGDDAFTSAWEAGRAMTTDAAVAYALEGEAE